MRFLKLSTRLVAGVVAALAVAGGGPAQAGTNTDNFSVTVNYLTNGLVTTMWEGIYTNVGDIPNATGVGGAAANVTVVNANSTTASNLTVLSAQTDWENAADDGFFLFKIVTGDFDVSTRIVPPIDTGAFNHQGLMVRAFGPAGAPIQPTNSAVTENYLMVGRFDQFGIANMLTPNINGGEVDTALGTFPNSNYWIRIERSNNVFRIYESTTNTSWTLVNTQTRNDFNGVPLQVGIAHATYGNATQRTARYSDFSLSGPNVNPVAPPSPATGLTMSTNGLSNAVALTWTPGAGSAGSVVVMRAVNAITRQPSYGITNSGNSQFGSGQHLGGSNHVVFVGSGTNVTVSNLAGGVRYFAAVYSYSGAGTNINYNLTTPAAGSQIIDGVLQLTSISLTVNPVVPINGSGQGTVTGNYLGGGSSNVTSLATYTSSATNIISIVSNTGAFQGLAYGSATLTASFQGQTNSRVVTVINPILNALTHRYSFTSNAVDSIAAANGILSNGASISNGMLVMDGANDFLDLPDNLVTNYTAVTIEAWVRDDGSSNSARIFDFGNGVNNYMFLSLPSSSNNLRGAIKAGGGVSEQVLEWPSGGKPGVGQMAHVVWTSDSATSRGVLYVNGVAVGTNANMTNSPAAVGTMTNDWLGRSQFAADPFFKGAIDEFRTYSVALPPGAVLSNYLSGPNVLPTGVIGLTGVKHRWSFDEGTGTNVADSLGTAHGNVIILSTTDFIWTNGGVRLAGGTRTTADYVQFPPNLIHNLGDVSVEVWATPRSAQTWSRVFDFGMGNNSGLLDFYLSFARGANLNLQRYEFDPAPGWRADTSLTTATLQQYHYVATWSAHGATNGGGLARWFRDGVLITNVNTGSLSVANVNDAVMWLGRSQFTADNTANADFTEVRIYNRELTPDEVNFSRVNGPDALSLVPPVAVDDFITLNPGAMVLYNALLNDQGNLLNPATVQITGGPGAGTAQVKPDGRILYTHTNNLAVSDSFTYTVQDVQGTVSTPATVHITISTSLRLANTTITLSNSPPPVAYQIVDAFTNLTGTFDDPVALRSPPPGGPPGSSNMLFVVERRGNITFVTNTAAPNPVRQMFLSMNITNQVAFDNTVEGEMGFLGFDFHPNFWSNGYIYLYYVGTNMAGVPPNSFYDRVSRFQATNLTTPGALTVDTNTELAILNVQDQVFNHNAGDIHFGPDGYLYISMGDEGDQYNFRHNSQRIDRDFYAGLLRIDVDRTPGGIEPKTNLNSNGTISIPRDTNGFAFYNIPSDNPFVGATNFFGAPITNQAGLREEFWAVGLRHPWRFSIDTNGEVWVGDVGQDRFEEINVVQKGSNYGWAYYEADTLAKTLYPTQNNLLTNPPPGMVMPLYQYTHMAVNDGGDPQFKGDSISGGFVYHGNNISAINGAYMFADFEGANLWALRRLTNGSVSVERLAGELGIAALGPDPANGDVLMANYRDNRIRRLVKVDISNSSFPEKLSETGIFADLATLTPNPGIVSYQPNVAFWSDHAIKTRWFTIPDLTNTIGFTPDGNWQQLPVGTKWIKHFDMEMTRGNPATKQRVETRILTKTAGGTFGISYKWTNTQDEAYLVGDAGDSFPLTITNNGSPVVQNYEIPPRASCLSCHTPAGGFALTFNTREMNKVGNLNGINANQIAALSAAGYFSSPVGTVAGLPAHAPATDTNYSLEYRVRSYLEVNCVQCHQPTGPSPGSWDARAMITLAQTGLINGTPLLNDGGNPTNKLIVPGDTNHSVLLMRLENTNGFARMPPLATHELDIASIQLVQNWITLELPNHLTYAQWIALYPALIGPAADPGNDPDGDGANNYFEFLTGTDPNNASSKWQITLAAGGGQVQVTYPRVANLGVVIETSNDLINWVAWNVTGNQPFFAATAGTTVLSGPVSTIPPYQFFRARLIEP